LFGYPEGTIVRPNSEFKAKNPAIYVWFEIGFDNKRCAQRIPSEKFVAVIVKKDEKYDRYCVKWIADNRADPFPSFYVWKPYMFKVVDRDD